MGSGSVFGGSGGRQGSVSGSSIGAAAGGGSTSPFGHPSGPQIPLPFHEPIPVPGCRVVATSRKDAIAAVARLTLQLGGRTLGAGARAGIIDSALAVRAAQAWESQLATQSPSLSDYIREKQMVMRRLRLGVPRAAPAVGGTAATGYRGAGNVTAAGRMAALACAQGLLGGADVPQETQLRLQQFVMQPAAFAAAEARRRVAAVARSGDSSVATIRAQPAASMQMGQAGAIAGLRIHRAAIFVAHDQR